VQGLLLVDKPAGPSSFGVVKQVRRLTGAKTGHAGTLDPAATGLMLILLGSATKQAQSLLKLDKTYLAKLQLGSSSSTGDAEGDIQRISDQMPSPEQVAKVLASFNGTFDQTPPAHSAIKVGGQRAYKLARQGKPVVLKPRLVTVSISQLSYRYPYLEIEAAVSSGTYIRSLAADIGQALQTGAYLAALRRTRVGQYRLEDALDLGSLTEAKIEQNLIPL
jgi:tRNA pseudouridine55 synthase